MGMPSDKLSKIQPIFSFIEKKYFSQGTNKNIRILLDENNTPIWAIIFTLFRAGLYDEIQDVFEYYNGNIDLSSFEDLFRKYCSESQSMLESSEDFKRRALKAASSKRGADEFENNLLSIFSQSEIIENNEHFLSDTEDYFWHWVKLQTNPS